MADKEIVDASRPRASSPAGPSLPKRDFWLLPALSLLTMFLLFAGAEFVARGLWRRGNADPCQTDTAVYGKHFKPNCASTIKAAEGPWVLNTYNECGYRSGESCGPKPAGATRVAVLGSSSSFGYMDPYEDSYTTLLAHSFSKECRRKFDFQDLGYPGDSMLDIYRQMGAALALKPDLMLVVITALDLRHPIDRDALLRRDDPAEAAPQNEPAAPKSSWLNPHVVQSLRDSRVVYMLQDAMFRDPDTFLRLYLLHGDDAGFLKSPLSPAWRRRMLDTDLLLGGMAKQAAAASVPMVLVVAPGPADVAVLYAQPRQGVDPKGFPASLADIAARHHIPMIDGIGVFAGRPNPMGLFYLVNGHLEKSGEKVLADTIASRLPPLAPTVFHGCSIDR